MNGYLLDTNVISKLAPQRPEPDPVFRGWLLEKGAADQLFLPAMTIAEIAKAIRKLACKGTTERSRLLQDWLDGLLTMFDDRILPMDRAVALIAGRMEEDAVANGFAPGLADVIIAATDYAHNLIVVTENGRHFEPLGIPFERPVVG